MNREAAYSIIELAMKWQNPEEWTAVFTSVDCVRASFGKRWEQNPDLRENRYFHGQRTDKSHWEFTRLYQLVRLVAPELLEYVPAKIDFFRYDRKTDRAFLFQGLRKIEETVRAQLMQNLQRVHGGNVQATAETFSRFSSGYLEIIVDQQTRILERDGLRTMQIPGTLLWPLAIKLVSAGSNGLTSDEFKRAVEECGGQANGRYVATSELRRYFREIRVVIPDARSTGNRYRLAAES